MPWKDVSLMSQRLEFVMLARKGNVSAVCHRFGISRKTGYKWLARYAGQGSEGLEDLPRTPGNSPLRTPPEMEAVVLALRDEHPAWGGRKLRARLAALGLDPPAASTITAILRRNGRLDPAQSEKHAPWQRFERESPNELWQMDFKGDFPLARGGRCHPLTVIDDHSRYSVCLKACPDQRGRGVRAALTETFRNYGMPERMLMDNGACWGPHNEAGFHTAFTAWLIRLGVGISHGRIYHPQTQGKNERFNRTLKAELVGTRTFNNIAHCQEHFDRWRTVYNMQRPHEAIAMAPPVTRYRPSAREFPESLPPIEYSPGDAVRKVYSNATISFRGKIIRVGKAFIGQPVAVRPAYEDGMFNIFYCHQHIVTFDLASGEFSYQGRLHCPSPRGEGQ